MSLYIKKLQPLVILLCIALSGCDYTEEQRVISQTEKELGIRFFNKPKMLLTETYGWAEEGGDRTLLQLNPEDCTEVSKRLKDETAMADGDAYRLFNSIGITPKRIQRQFKFNENGDTRNYELDKASCLLDLPRNFRTV